MSVRAGTVPIKFSDGKIRPIPVDKKDAVLKAFPDAYVYDRRTEMARTLGNMEPAMGGVGGSMAGAYFGGLLGGLGGPAAPLTVPLGAMAGGALGGALGGGAGHGAKELTYRAAGLGDAPGTAMDAAKEQALFGAGGELMGLGAKGLGWGLVRTGVAGKGEGAIRAVNEMIRERIPVGGTERLTGVIPTGARKIPIIGPSLVRGSEAAGQNYEQALAARNRVNAQAGAQGVEIPASPQEQEFVAMHAKYQGRSDRSKQLNALRRRYVDFRKTWAGGKLSPDEAQQFLTSLDEEAKGLWEARDKKQYVPPADKIVAQQAKQLSNVLRQQMRDLIPGHQIVSDRLSKAMAAKAAVGGAEEHPGMMKMIGRGTIGAGIGAAVGSRVDPNHLRGGASGSAIGGLLTTTPSAVTRLGLLLSDPVIQALLRQGPRFAAQDQTRTR